MKKSELLKLEAQEEENDFRALNLHTKSLREARLEKFADKDYTLLLERSGCVVVPFNGSKIVIDTQTDKFGILDYFPKGNKVLFRNKNEWKSQGLRWLIDNICNKKD